MTLPHDYSRCATEGCEKESDCARKELPDSRYYSVVEFDKDDCENFIDKEGNHEKQARYIKGVSKYQSFILQALN